MCSNLKTLYLHNNRLTAFPESIGNLTRLKALDLKHNPKLVEIPDTVLNLPENCTIDISREGASEARLQHLQETSATEGYRGPSFRIQ